MDEAAWGGSEVGIGFAAAVQCQWRGPWTGWSLQISWAPSCPGWWWHPSHLHPATEGPRHPGPSWTDPPQQKYCPICCRHFLQGNNTSHLIMAAKLGFSPGRLWRILRDFTFVLPTRFLRRISQSRGRGGCGYIHSWRMCYRSVGWRQWRSILVSNGRQLRCTWQPAESSTNTDKESKRGVALPCLWW